MVWKPALLLFLGLPLGLNAAIYKYTDANGKVVYGDKPAQGQQSTQLQVERKQAVFAYQVTLDGIGLSIPKAETQKIKADLERVMRFYRNGFYLRFGTPPNFRIKLFEKRADYQAYHSGPGKTVQGWSGGLYSPSKDEISVWRTDGKRVVQWSRLRATLRHEASHALMQRVSPHTPSWLNEGIAELAEDLVEKGGRLRIEAGNLSSKLAFLDRGTDPLDSLSEFMRVDGWKWSEINAHDSDFQTYQYAQGVLCFLLSERSTRDIVTRILNKKRRLSHEALIGLIEKYYLGGLKNLDRNWRRWRANPGCGVEIR